MANGLFAVYRDSSAPAAPTASSSRPAGLHNKPTSRRANGVEGSSRGLRLQEKENIDPFALRDAGKAGSGKMKKPALGAKSVESCGAAGKARPLPAKTGSFTKPSVNGVCTGTLRTRVLPDPLFADDSCASGKSDGKQVDLTPAPPSTAPQVVEIYPSSSTSTPCRSTYARSCGKTSDEDLELESGPAFGEYGDESDASETSSSASIYEANRRARALTESPLAEITQAFTGLGGFSAANMSPSPSPTSTTFNRPPPATRTRSSPSKTTLSAIPPRMQPYSTTATTKRVKPGQTAPLAPRAAPASRTMRL
ncbi:hypothetical protein JCM10213_004776 [Rhodosporidiobolus nylandii]